MASSHATRYADTAAAWIAVNDHQQVALSARRDLAGLSDNKRAAIRLSQANTTTINDEEPLDTCGVAVFVMSSHNRPVEYEYEQVLRYLSLIGGGVKLNGFLGGGTDGAVWATDRDTAIKSFAPAPAHGYENERDTYERLAHFGVTDKIGEFWIPTMVEHNDDLLIVEMDIMHSRPYVIDFAKVRLNSSPDFPEQTRVDNEEHGRFLFDDNWPRVETLLSQFEAMLIFYLDPKPHNIVFPGWPDMSPS